ncbi:hypothetical protein B5M09_002208 [Aphanomyces astaci]|uniref:PX domain-containing protein n=1 Tax=Aphanomyces astaci TaxID=112090 RepID=A0A3R7Z4Y2_APHAT|nr:hypothetical protein B5M09_002208 [Aphanomyces astaci]
MQHKAAAVERQPSGTNVLLPSATTPPDCIICRACKQPVHLDDIGDHDCKTSTSAPPPSRPGASKEPNASTLASRPSLNGLIPSLQPPAVVVSAPEQPAKPSGVMKPPLLTRKSSASSNQTADIQAHVTQVTVSQQGFATYRISSSLWPNGPQFTVDRRYRDFYAFATLLQLMLSPSSTSPHAMWVKLPPKTYCSRNTLTDGFLLRRKAGLEGFLSTAIDMLLNPKTTAGPAHKRTLTQMHVLREFLGIPAARDVHGAVRVVDGFNTIKRVATLPFPARAIFDLLVLPPHQVTAFNPNVVGGSILRKESTSMWVEHVQLKTLWLHSGVDCVNVKSWRLEPNGSIVVVSIPAASADCPPQVTATAQGVLTGWILAPVTTPEDDSTVVTMVTQMDLRRHLGPNSTWNKLALRNYAMDITYIHIHLEKSFEKAYYDAVGPLVSADELHSLTLHPQDMQKPVVAGNKDPKVFLLCQQIEPQFCLLIHKNTNRNALILKLHQVSTDGGDDQVHAKDPLVGEWVMFEKTKNPRCVVDLSGVHAISFGMLKGRTFQLRNQQGYSLYGTVNGKPNVVLKRFYLTFAPSMVGLGQLDKVELVGDTETEVVFVR